ncbi:MAG: hypothetical protein V1917_02445 [Candidatus Gottesmanbacteria bacterium]
MPKEKEKSPSKQQPHVVYEPFYDGAHIQSRTPYPDDLTMQNPDELFLTELLQTSEQEADAIEQHVIGKIHGNIRKIRGAIINNTTFRKPVETQFTILESAGRLGLARFNKDKHGPWTDLQDMELTPVEFIRWYRDQEEPTPGLLKEFMNLRKQQSASKMHWESKHHPKPKRQTK